MRVEIEHLPRGTDRGGVGKGLPRGAKGSVEGMEACQEDGYESRQR